MQCYGCKHDFCWMCLGDWKTHGSEYYRCSRYEENPNVANESSHARAKEALKKLYTIVAIFFLVGEPCQEFAIGGADFATDP